MLAYAASKLVGIACGFLYPAYSSFVTVKRRDPHGYSKWMMYWIVFAVYNVFEPFMDFFLSLWFPFYYEIKILFILWLMCPATNGSGFIYRKFLHPKLVRHEPEIEEHLIYLQTNTTSLLYNWAGRVITIVAETLADTFVNITFRRAEGQGVGGGFSFFNQWRTNPVNTRRSNPIYQNPTQGSINIEELSDDSEFNEQYQDPPSTIYDNTQLNELDESLDTIMNRRIQSENLIPEMSADEDESFELKNKGHHWTSTPAYFTRSQSKRPRNY